MERSHPYGPRAIPLDESGRAAWVSFTNCIAGQLNADNFPAHLVGPWNKLREYGARLSLVVRCLRWACGEISDPDEGVGAEDVYRAARLVTYFASHARKVYAEMDSDPVIAMARKIVTWIVGRTKPCDTFTRREAHRLLQSECPTAQEVDPVLALLVQHGHIRPLFHAENARRGRPASPTYEVHPQIYSLVGS
jgi:replicative DNA helicase